MQIATHITLTQAEIKEAIEQYLNSHNISTKDKSVEFDHDLPENLTVIVSDTVQANTKDEQLVASRVRKSTCVDYSDLEDPFTPPQPIKEEDVVIPQREVVALTRPFNPFAEHIKELDQNSSITDKPSVPDKLGGSADMKPGEPINPFALHSLFR